MSAMDAVHCSLCVFFHRAALEFKVVQPPLCGARDVNALQDHIRVEELFATCLELIGIWFKDLGMAMS